MDPSQTPTTENPETSLLNPEASAEDTLHQPRVVQAGAVSVSAVITPATSPANDSVKPTNVNEQPVIDKPAEFKKVPPKKMIIAAILAGIFLLGLGIFMFIRSSDKLNLVVYETESSSFLVPESYDQVAQESGRRFEEKDDNPQNRSFVTYIYQPYMMTLTEEEKASFIEAFRSQIPEFLKTFADSTDEKISDITTERILTEEKNAVRARATINKGEARANFDIIIMFGEQGIYALAVAAHESDTNLKEVNSSIINSLTVVN